MEFVATEMGVGGAIVYVVLWRGVGEWGMSLEM